MTDTCDIYCVDDGKVADIKAAIDDTIVQGTSRIFKVLADDTRLKVAYALTIQKELCVCDVAEVIGSSTATASHHLRALKKQGLAQFRKEGKLAYYRLDDDHVIQLIQTAVEHEKEGKADV